MALFDNKYLPWIIGGGVLVGGYLLLSSGGSSGSSGAVGYNAAQLDLVALQANLSAQTEQARISAESTDTATIASTFANLMGAKYSRDTSLAAIAAGTQQTAIQNDTALKIERQNNITQRLGIRTGLKADVVNANAQVAMTQIQAQTAQAIAHLQAAVQQQGQTLGFIGSLVGGIGQMLGLASPVAAGA